MSEDFEERWGFAPDSDYEIRKTNRPVGYMTEQELEEELKRMGYELKELDDEN